MFASSNHAVGFYPRRRRIGVDDAVRPDLRYGVSKAFGEAVAALYAVQAAGCGVTCIRIGNFGDAPLDSSAALDLADAGGSLFSSSASGSIIPTSATRSSTAPPTTPRGWWDNTEAAYPAMATSRRPRRGFPAIEALASHEAKLPADPIGEMYQGGTYCSRWSNMAAIPKRRGFERRLIHTARMSASPRLRAPRPGQIDTHIHFYDRKYLLAPTCQLMDPGWVLGRRLPSRSASGSGPHRTQ